jgi:hypothetical protein
MSIPSIIDAQMRNHDSQRHANIIDVHHLHFLVKVRPFNHRSIRKDSISTCVSIYSIQINQWTTDSDRMQRDNQNACSRRTDNICNQTHFSVISLSDLFSTKPKAFERCEKFRERDRWCKSHLQLRRWKHHFPIISLMFRLESRWRQWEW